MVSCSLRGIFQTLPSIWGTILGQSFCQPSFIKTELIHQVWNPDKRDFFSTVNQLPNFLGSSQEVQLHTPRSTAQSSKEFFHFPPKYQKQMPSPNTKLLLGAPIPSVNNQTKPHPPCVLHHFLVWLAIVGGVGIGVIAQLGQHGGNHWHVLQDISWDLPNPLGQGFHVHWLDHLVSGSFNPGEEEKKKLFSIPTSYSSITLRSLACFVRFFSPPILLFSPLKISCFLQSWWEVKF